ncbi:MAG TPA: radical SAM protein [Bacteroidales bacterium]|nr:radical SAM protein [Bacteroidales bacterium]HRZ21468.1 radical SAM protein [Bacteroidales bacterium]
MRTLTIRGEKKRIPPYPHHKNFVYRANLFFTANHLLGWFMVNGPRKALRRMWIQKRYGFSVPLNLLIDPTSACNLNCLGCWAADYGKTSELSYDKLDEILTEAWHLGIYDIVMSGGEPLMRKADILRLCEKHKELSFALFTNGTLIDDSFADEIARLGNLNIFVSIEGFREKTDFRRGKGTFDKATAAMDLLKSRDIGFGFSVCYHALNYEEVCSDAFLDFLLEKGAWMGWMFIYMPIGSDADSSLCLNANQRTYVREKLGSYRTRHRFTLIDFANLGHKAFGCVAAGNEFAHINAHGDLEPCAFFHYSDTNLHDKTLKEALASPFFRHFRKHKPLSENPHRPCPIMDVPEKLVPIIHHEGVLSTHLHHPETAEALASKTRPLAEGWKIKADELFRDMPEKEKRKFRRLARFIIYRH